MSRFFMLFGFVLVMGCGQAYAQTNTSSGQDSASSSACFNDKIINTNGQSIRMNSGQRFQGYPGSNATLSFWLPLDKVKICRLGGNAYEIINLDKKNQVKALRIN